MMSDILFFLPLVLLSIPLFPLFVSFLPFFLLICQAAFVAGDNRKKTSSKFRILLGVNKTAWCGIKVSPKS